MLFAKGEKASMNSVSKDEPLNPEALRARLQRMTGEEFIIDG